MLSMGGERTTSQDRKWPRGLTRKADDLTSAPGL